jgi:hypothetical protein
MTLETISSISQIVGTATILGRVVRVACAAVRTTQNQGGSGLHPAQQLAAVKVFAADTVQFKPWDPLCGTS